MKAISAFVLLALLGVVSVHSLKLSEVPRKSLAGPPSEFGMYNVPGPLVGAIAQDSAQLEIKLEQDSTGSFSWDSVMVVDSAQEWSFSVLSPLADSFAIKVVDPNGNVVDIESAAVKGSFPIGLNFVPETTYRFTNPVVGSYSIHIECDHTLSAQIGAMDTHVHQGLILLWNDSPVRSYTHLNTYDLIQGTQIGLVTEVTEDSTLLEGVRATPLRDTITTAEMEVVMPDGNEIDVPMYDDGLHGDLEANDGIYGATVAATEQGTYRVAALITGTHTDGTPFVRSSVHLIPVVANTLTLGSSANGQMKDSTVMSIYVDVQSTADVDTLYRAYAEVWGKDVNGNDVPVCWVAGMVNVDSYNGAQAFALNLNTDWLSYSNAMGPLTLKNVQVQETDSYIPISTATEIPVAGTNSLAPSKLIAEITPEMRRGKFVLAAKQNVTGNAKLILVHGYCAGVNPWEADSHIFTDAEYFLQANANLDNEEFATNVLNYVQSNGITSFGLIGHSQGGLVGLHMLNYFETGLDYASGSRTLQSVGSPYKGCSGAGSAADLIALFGVACGANDDLTVDGARLWLAGITQEAQKEVYYYTTTYEQGNFFGDYCNMAVNAVLDWPNDGTTELSNAQLPYGNNMGNTQKQCHTTEMKYMAQYEDANRNAIMNQGAAR